MLQSLYAKQKRIDHPERVDIGRICILHSNRRCNRLIKICIGCDHRGFELKSRLIKLCPEYEFKDLGCFTPEVCDYPDLACKMSQEIEGYGILICNTGIGMSIAANRYANLYAALCLNVDMSYTARAHNNANVLIIPAKYVTSSLAVELVVNFVSSNFDDSKKNKSRLEKIGKIY